MSRISRCKEILKKIELLREDLNLSFHSISRDELLRKSRLLDKEIVKYMKLKCRWVAEGEST